MKIMSLFWTYEHYQKQNPIKQKLLVFLKKKDKINRLVF